MTKPSSNPEPKHCDNSAFQAARIALYSARLQARLQEERSGNKGLDDILRDEESKNGYPGPVPLVNRATYMAMLYFTALWLRNKYFGNNQTVKILRKHIRPFVENGNVIVCYGPAAARFSGNNAELFARRLRNAIAHADVTINNDTFEFKDTNFRKEEDWVRIKMPWLLVGEYTSALIAAGNELLYAQQTTPGKRVKQRRAGELPGSARNLTPTVQ